MAAIPAALAIIQVAEPLAINLINFILTHVHKNSGPAAANAIKKSIAVKVAAIPDLPESDVTTQSDVENVVKGG